MKLRGIFVQNYINYARLQISSCSLKFHILNWYRAYSCKRGLPRLVPGFVRDQQTDMCIRRNGSERGRSSNKTILNNNLRLLERIQFATIESNPLRHNTTRKGTGEEGSSPGMVGWKKKLNWVMDGHNPSNKFSSGISLALPASGCLSSQHPLTSLARPSTKLLGYWLESG